MASRIKEQEKNEKIVRGLTKLADNRKCINCGSLGPQYVCTNFSIFVCTTCSGIHREFTHRVKSISMATFTPAEVAALQAGGNQRARENYLKEWDSSRHSLPETSNPDKLRDFIRAVYVDKRFSGDRRGRLSDGEDTFKQPDRSKYGQSPSYEDCSDDRRYANRPGSRGSDRGFDDKMSPARFEERDRSYQGDRDYRDRDRRYEERDRRFDDRDRRYEDRDRNYDDRRYDDRRYDRRVDERDRRYDDRDRKYDDRRYDERDRRYDERDRYEEQRRGDRSSEDFDKRLNRPPSYRGGETPPLRSVRDILGEDVPKLRVEDASRANGRAEDTESPHSTSSQGDWRLRSSKSLDRTGSGSLKAAVAPVSAAPSAVPPAVPPQPTISESLIDFSAEPEPPKAVTPTTTFDPFAEPPKTSTTSFDPFATTAVNAEPPKANAPFGDAFTAEAPKASQNASFDPFGTAEQPGLAASSTAGWASFDLSPPKATSAPTDLFQQPVSTQAKPNGGWGISPLPNGLQTLQPVQGQIPQPMQGFQQNQNLQPVSSLQQAPHGAQQHQAPPAPTVNGFQSQRREIPEGLFFSPQVAPYHVGGMPMQMRFPQGPQPQPPPFGAGMPGPMPYVQPPARTKSNPFDLPGDGNQNFPNMASLQSALPGFHQGPLGPPPTQWPQQGMPPPPGLPSFPPGSFPPSFPGGGFPSQQMSGHMMQPPPPQAHTGGFGNSQGLMNGGNQLPFPVQPAAGGNPFG